MKPIGVISPLEAPNDDYPRMLGELKIPHTSVVTAAADSHQLDDVRAAGDHNLLASAARSLADAGAGSVIWACTSGSFTFGLAGAQAQAAAMQAAAGVPATSTSMALLDALAALEVTRVDVLSPYPQEVTDALEAFLAEAGVSVAETTLAATAGPSVSKRITSDDVTRFLAHSSHDRLLVVPDTAISGCALSEKLTGRLRNSAIFANQWTIWAAASQEDRSASHAGLGPLSGASRSQL
jgi:maleate cis-trans isomerase